MKKLIYLIIAMLVLGLIVTGCELLPVVPTLGEKGHGNGNNVHGNGIDLTGYHYNLNLIGKKDNWPGGGNYTGDRHTMFVPEDTSGLKFTVGNRDFEGIKISMTSSVEGFAVIDGNWFDNEECAFQLGPNKYQVYIVAKAKPAKKNEADYITNITGWVYAEDEATHTPLLYLDLGTVTVKKSKKWTNATYIFEVEASQDPFGLVGTDDMWVFEYLSKLEAYFKDPGSIPFIEDPFTEYFWQFDNKGNKLIKVRFYPVD